jgi:hypothetical protein
MVIVKIDGAETEVEDDIAATDESLKNALAEYYSGVMNATIKRTEQNGQKYIEIVKRAGPLGAVVAKFKCKPLTPQQAVIKALEKAPERINPAILHAREIQLKVATNSLVLTDLLQSEDARDKAIEVGEKECDSIRKSLDTLQKAPPVAARRVPVGF